RIRRRQPLQAGSDIGRLAERELFLASTAADLPYDDQPCVHPDPHRQPDPVRASQASVQGSEGRDDPEASTYGALGIVFMRLRIATVDQQAIAEILRDMPLKALDDLGAGGLV